MLKSYFSIALRSLRRDKNYAFINILGLSIAIASTLVLVDYIRYELSFDKHNQNYQRIVRVASEFTKDEKTTSLALSSPVLGPLFIQDYPQVGEFVRFRNRHREVVSYEDRRLYQDRMFYADANVFDIFAHEAVFGNLEPALTEPNTVVISETLSKQYFDSGNPVGKNLRLSDVDYRVTAVFKDLPENSHLKYSALISYTSLGENFFNTERMSPELIFNLEMYTYFKLNNSFEASTFPQLLNTFYVDLTKNLDKDSTGSLQGIVQRLDKVHYDSGIIYDEPTGSRFLLYWFGIIALFIVLVVSINYTNLAVARATRQIKEVGIRKTLGAGSTQLFLQFMVESLAYTLIALVLGIVLIEFAEAYSPLTSLLNKQALFSFTEHPSNALWLAAFVIGLSFSAGAYPATYLSTFAPVKSMAQGGRIRLSRNRLRQVLIFLQFFACVGVVSSTTLMATQLNYLVSKPLGFNRNNVIVTSIHGADNFESLDRIRRELKTNPNVVDVAVTSYVLGELAPYDLFSMENSDGEMESVGVFGYLVGNNYIDTLDMEIVEGRDFSNVLLSDDEKSIIVNESLVKKMGWQQAIGKRIHGGMLGEARVVGVVKDFHLASLHQPIEPSILQLIPGDLFENFPDNQRQQITFPLMLKLSGFDLQNTLKHVEAVISRSGPEQLFSFKFLDDLLDQYYLSESTLTKLISLFSGICILIACMGLYGLCALTTEQRSKEIGIRRALGASLSMIIKLLSQSHLIIVVFAGAVGSTLSFVVMRNWLADFSYHVDINPWTFVISTTAVVFIALLTVSYQSFKAFNTDLIQVLKYE